METQLESKLVAKTDAEMTAAAQARKQEMPAADAEIVTEFGITDPQRAAKFTKPKTALDFESRRAGPMVMGG